MTLCPSLPVALLMTGLLLAPAGCKRHAAPESGNTLGEGRVLYEGDSAYNHMLVAEKESQRCLVFGAYRARKSRATCIDTGDDDRHVFDYTAKMFVGFLLHPETTRVATLGLGGGMVARTFARQLPGVKLDVVEIDPLVVRLARQYFGYTDAPNLELFVDDGRQFLHKATSRYDQIWVDAYNSDYIPAHMTTKEFLVEARNKLNPGGLLVSNVHSPNKLFLAQVATHRQVFKSVRVFRCNNNYNAIIVASDGDLPTDGAQLNVAAGFAKPIRGVDLSRVGSTLVNVDVGAAPVLTDDYGPANLLLQQQSPAL